MAEIGYHTIGANSFGANDQLQSSTWTAGQTGTISSIFVYCTPGSGTCSVVAGVYHTTTGTPDTLIQQSSAVALTPAGSPGWVQCTLASSASLTSGSIYGLCFSFHATTGTNVTGFYDTSGVPHYFGGAFTYPTLPNPWVGPSSGTLSLSMYATFDAASSPPVNTVAPVASGSTTLGSTVSVTDGTWTGSPSPTFTYQWQRDVRGNAVYSDIPSATSNSYVLAVLDDACNVRCNVTGTNGSGAATAASNSILDTTTPPASGTPLYRMMVGAG